MPMSLPTQDESMKTDGQTAGQIPAPVAENPIVNADSTIINTTPIVNADTVGGTGPIISGNPIQQPQEEFQEYMSAGCTAVVPPGARKIYLIMVTVTMLVGAALVYGLFRLLDL